MVMQFYKKSNLLEKSYFKAMIGCEIRGHIDTAKQIFKDKVNKSNVKLAISEYEDFCKPRDDWKPIKNSYNGEYLTEIHEMLKKFESTKF